MSMFISKQTFVVVSLNNARIRMKNKAKWCILKAKYYLVHKIPDESRAAGPGAFCTREPVGSTAFCAKPARR